MSQITNRVLLIRPRHFGFNEETAATCGFQEAPDDTCTKDKIRDDALVQFNKLKTLLESCGVEVNEENDRDDKELPDSVFPNNWLSFHTSHTPHQQPTMVLYPMMAPKRRQERQDDIIRKWKEKLDAHVFDMSTFENDGVFLEGTGSMVLDRCNRIAYVCISPRTNRSLVEKFCETLNYKSVIFSATTLVSGTTLIAIYHTNVMMCIAEKFVLICLDSIRDENERRVVIDSLEKSDKHVIPITEHQMNQFVGNAIQLRNHGNNRYLFMSTKAYNALEEWQKTEINKTCEIVHTSVDVIEKYGGGGVRCMIAEIFPPH